MKKWLLILLSICTISALNGQSKEQIYKQKLVLKAKKLYKEYNYVKALEVYEELNELGSSFAVRKIGDCYRQMNDLVKAEEYYAQAVKQKNIPPLYYFYYAQTLMSNGKYEAAMNWFTVYQKEKPNDENAEIMINACKEVLKTIPSASQYEITNLKLNSTAQDFAPSFYKDGIIFTSSRIEGVFRKRDTWTNTGYLDVYYTPVYWHDTITHPSKIKGHVNTLNFHDGPACIDEPNNIIYFTRNNVMGGAASKSKSGEIKLSIFSAEESGDGFRNSEELSFNSKEFSNAHPSINANGNVMFFSSDRAGGYGGTDIYYSTYNENRNKWNRPVNAGPEINTAGNERFPFIHESGSLFFASDGHTGFGGLDIFEAIPNDSIPFSFIKAVNLGYPINSSRDDFSYIIDSSKITGFFASNRKGGKGNDDIYRFTKATIPLYLTIASEDVPLDKAEVIIEELESTTTCASLVTNNDGQLETRLQPKKTYKVHITKNGYKTLVREIKTDDSIAPLHIEVDMQLKVK